jgi:hypothetical protein
MAKQRQNATAPERSAASAGWLLAAPAIWALHFFALYGAHTLLCIPPFTGAAGWLQAIVIGVTAIALLALAVSFRRARIPAKADFWNAAPLYLALLSALAVLWSGAATIFVSSCGT